MIFCDETALFITRESCSKMCDVLIYHKDVVMFWLSPPCHMMWWNDITNSDAFFSWILWPIGDVDIMFGGKEITWSLWIHNKNCDKFITCRWCFHHVVVMFSSHSGDVFIRRWWCIHNIKAMYLSHDSDVFITWWWCIHHMQWSMRQVDSGFPG